MRRMNKLLTLGVVSVLALGMFLGTAQAEKITRAPGGKVKPKEKLIEVIIGSDSDLRDARRVARLERALMQLQRRVMELEDEVYLGYGDPYNGGGYEDQRTVTCEVRAFNQAFFGTARSEGEAVAEATRNCQRAWHGMHCALVACRR